MNKMNVKILFFTGNKKEREFQFEGGRVEVGRAVDCNLVINDPMVSSRHLCLFEQNGQLFVQDLGSINGTFLNGQPVSDPVPVAHGAEISFCNYRMEIRMAESAGSPAASGPAAEPISGNKTMMISREDLEAAKGKKFPLSKNQMILAGVGIAMLLILLVLAVLPSGDNGGGSGNALRAGMLDTYFLDLEKRVRDETTNRNAPDKAAEYFRIGTERQKRSSLNPDADFRALLFYYRAKNSILETEPKPPLWDQVNPKIVETEGLLKKKIRKLFQDAWLAEKEGDKMGARAAYQKIQEMLPDEQSLIYRTAAFRKAKLQ